MPACPSSREVSRGEAALTHSAGVGWVNSDPLGPAELRGHVVLVNFCTLTCINRLRQEPYVRAWSRAYRDEGLTSSECTRPSSGSSTTSIWCGRR
jgi:hypothetical protein